jgi:hypothetical protein
VQLVGVVDSTVNRQFIQAKHARLSQQAKASKIDEATNKQFADILGDVMQSSATVLTPPIAGSISSRGCWRRASSYGEHSGAPTLRQLS